MNTQHQDSFSSLDSFVSLTNQDLLVIEGGKGKKKNPWYQPVLDFGQGFLDAF
jgi:hypothetical protein